MRSFLSIFKTVSTSENFGKKLIDLLIKIIRLVPICDICVSTLFKDLINWRFASNAPIKFYDLKNDMLIEIFELTSSGIIRILTFRSRHF